MTVQVDWSMNYTCGSQDEVASAHWSQDQVSLFTVNTWCQGKRTNKVLVLDSENHGKTNVAACLFKVLSGNIPDNVDSVHIWSDGPYGQFKNQFTFKTVELLQESLQRNIVWHFSATSHGKVYHLYDY